MKATHERLEQLLFAAAFETFSEAERVELNALLRDDAEARNFAAQFLSIDALLAENLAASEHSSAFQPIAISKRTSFRMPNLLAKAAAWIGAFHLFCNSAKASITNIIMKKTATSITAAIMIFGGTGIYAIHHHNESKQAEVATIESEILTLNEQLGIKTSRSSSRRSSAKGAQKTVGISQVLAIFDGDNIFMPHEQRILEQFENQLAKMDVESLKNLLLDAEKISNPIHGRVLERIIAALTAKDPAEATQIARELNGRSTGFQSLLSVSAAKAFKAWQEKDPATADAWYVATAAAGGLNSNNIPPNGLEYLSIDRSFARLRFAAQVLANPAAAAEMIATMLPADVTSALKEVTDPSALRQIIPMLAPEQKVPAAEGAIKAMAANDPNAAFTWAKSLGIAEKERDTLMASGIESAVASGKLDLAGVSAWAKSLDLDADRRAKMLVTAAEKSSIAPGGDERAVAWERTAERIDWLRKEAPPAEANKLVGEYLGQLAYGSYNPDQSFKAYEQEVAKQGNPDPELTIAYARWLSMHDSQHLNGQALKYLKQLPASQQRDEAINNIQSSR